MAHIKNRFGLSIVGALLLLIVAALAGGAFAGPLDPPAPPASTQATLLFQPADCTGFPISIASPGSYRLAQNITLPASCAKDGINITAYPVDLDLGG